MTELALGEELIGDGEDECIEQITRQNLLTMTLDKETGKQVRAQHTKGHGCVKARFVIRENLDKKVKLGVFAKAKTFDAMIRFSNGAKKDDRQSDAHGMAIKLPGVRNDGGDQDFILVDHPVFFAEGVRDYLAFNTHFHQMIFFKKEEEERIRAWFDPRAASSTAQWCFLWMRSKYIFARGLMMIMLQEPKLLPRLKRFAGQTPSSPLKTHYWSTLPYRLGDNKAVKYVAHSPRAEDPEAAAGVTSHDGLGKALEKALAVGPARFTFGIYLQTDPARHPVEDGTVNWAEADAEYHEIADIEIPQQEIDRTYDKTAVFTPWNAAEEHRPLGGINRVRGKVYDEMGKERLKDQEAS